MTKIPPVLLVHIVSGIKDPMPIVRVMSLVPRLTLDKPLLPPGLPMVGQTFLPRSLYLELRLLNQIPPHFFNTGFPILPTN